MSDTATLGLPAHLKAALARLWARVRGWFTTRVVPVAATEAKVAEVATAVVTPPKV